jgi:hypothetical protein
MSVIITALAVGSACVFLFYFCLSLRACIAGGGFKTVGDLVGIILILVASAALALWLGPIGLVGLGAL